MNILEVSQMLTLSKQQCQAEKPRLSSIEHKAITKAIPLLRKHLLQAYSGYKGKTYLEVRTCLVLDAKRYYGECVAIWLDKTLPTIAEGDTIITNHGYYDGTA